jgi:hypothetical protein
MKNILIVCPKPFLCNIVEQYLNANYPEQNFVYDNYPFICERNCKPLGLERRADGYYLSGEKTDEFSDYAVKYPFQTSTEYAIAKSEFIKNSYNDNIDLVLFVGCKFPCDILACTDYCTTNNIPQTIAFHSSQVSFFERELDAILDLDNIEPLFEIAENMKF